MQLRSEPKTKLFRYCPSCGKEGISWDGKKCYLCPNCQFEYFQNTASATIAILEYQDQVLFTVRNQQPHWGALDLPGGFTDPDETAEDALRREIKEELDINLGKLTYLGSFPNFYPYNGTLYTSCDSAYIAQIEELPTFIEKEEINDYKLFPADNLPTDQVPFQSIRLALEAYVKYKSAQQL